MEETYTAIIIDDESWTRDVLRYVGKWKELGIEIVAEASDGEYGLELALSLNPDIIITDVKMPNMDGLKLGEELRKRNCTSEILYISGYDEFAYVRTALRYQAIDYILKPVKPDELNEQLKRCIQELKKKARKREENAELNMDKVLQKTWIGEYAGLKEKIYKAMQKSDRSAIEACFAEVRELIRRNEGKEPAKDVSVYIYYDLYNLIHRYIRDNGYSYEEIQQPQNANFVFGTDFSLDDMVIAMERLADTVSGTIGQKAAEKHRINLEEAERYIRENYLRGITLEETADYFCVTREYLSKWFKDKVGINFSRYLTDLKMKKAKELLLVEKMAIKDVAETVGYQEPGGFYRAFKKYYGTAPSEMLQKIAHEQKKD